MTAPNFETPRPLDTENLEQPENTEKDTSSSTINPDDRQETFKTLSEQANQEKKLNDFEADKLLLLSGLPISFEKDIQNNPELTPAEKEELQNNVFTASGQEITLADIPRYLVHVRTVLGENKSLNLSPEEILKAETYDQFNLTAQYFAKEKLQTILKENPEDQVSLAKLNLLLSAKFAPVLAKINLLPENTSSANPEQEKNTNQIIEAYIQEIFKLLDADPEIQKLAQEAKSSPEKLIAIKEKITKSRPKIPEQVQSELNLPPTKEGETVLDLNLAQNYFAYKLAWKKLRTDFLRTDLSPEEQNKISSLIWKNQANPDAITAIFRANDYLRPGVSPEDVSKEIQNVFNGIDLTESLIKNETVIFTLARSYRENPDLSQKDRLTLITTALGNSQNPADQALFKSYQANQKIEADYLKWYAEWKKTQDLTNQNQLTDKQTPSSENLSEEAIEITNQLNNIPASPSIDNLTVTGITENPEEKTLTATVKYGSVERKIQITYPNNSKVRPLEEQSANYTLKIFDDYADQEKPREISINNLENLPASLQKEMKTSYFDQIWHKILKDNPLSPKIQNGIDDELMADFSTLDFKNPAEIQNFFKNLSIILNNPPPSEKYNSIQEQTDFFKNNLFAGGGDQNKLLNFKNALISETPQATTFDALVNLITTI